MISSPLMLVVLRWQMKQLKQPRQEITVKQLALKIRIHGELYR